MMTKATATTSSPVRSLSVTAAPMSVSSVEPVAPYSRLMPYSSTALANTPSR